MVWESGGHSVDHLRMRCGNLADNLQTRCGKSADTERTTCGHGVEKHGHCAGGSEGGGVVGHALGLN